MNPLKAYVTRQLRLDEAEVLYAYRDHLGFLTISVGILIDKRRGGGLRPEESAFILGNRIDLMDVELRATYSWYEGLADPRKAALLNMRHQLGKEGLARFQRMLGCLRDEKWAEAETHALDSKWAREDSPDRARRVARQLMTGEYQYGVPP